MKELLDVTTLLADKFSVFLSSSAGTKILNLVFISSIIFIALASLALLIKQDLLLIFAVLFSAGTMVFLFFLSTWASPIPERYSALDNILIYTGLRTIEDPNMRFSIGTGSSADTALTNAIDAALSKVIGAGAAGIYLKIYESKPIWGGRGFRDLFEIQSHKETDNQTVIEVKWSMLKLRTFLLRSGFSMAPAIVDINFSINPYSTPKEGIKDQILVLYKTRSIFFNNGFFYATCDAIKKEITRMQFKTTAGETTLKSVTLEEKTDVDNKNICILTMEPVIIKQ